MYCCYSYRVQLGKRVTLGMVIIEMIGHLVCVIISGVGLTDLSKLEDTNDNKDEYTITYHGRKLQLEGHSEKEKDTELLKAKITFTFVPLCAIASVGLLSSLLLLCGMFRVKVSLRMIQVWLLIRSMRIFVSIGFMIQAFISTYIKTEYAAGYSGFIILEFLTILVVWAFAEETKQANHTIQPIASFR